MTGQSTIANAAVKLEPFALHDAVLATIRRAILDGTLEPGAVYSARALARDLGVSQTPVREAMLKLVSEGIMAPVPRGFQFIALSESDLAELTWIRALLEPPAVRLAAEHATDEQLQPFVSQIDAMAAAVDRKDIPAFFELDRNFHLGLVHLSGRKHLAAIIEQLRDRTWRYRVAATTPQDVVRHLLSEHRELLRHIQEGEGESAAALLRDHILG